MENHQLSKLNEDKSSNIDGTFEDDKLLNNDEGVAGSSLKECDKDGNVEEFESKQPFEDERDDEDGLINAQNGTEDEREEERDDEFGYVEFEFRENDENRPWNFEQYKSKSNGGLFQMFEDKDDMNESWFSWPSERDDTKEERDETKEERDETKEEKKDESKEV